MLTYMHIYISRRLPDIAQYLTQIIAFWGEVPLSNEFVLGNL